MYEAGWGVQVNEVGAVKWYQEAAEMQHDVAQLRLGMMLIIGVGADQSVNDGLSLLRQSAENGNRVAEALIQDLFDAGDVELEDAVRIVAGIRRVLDEGEKQTLETLRRSLELMHKKTTTARSTSSSKKKIARNKRVDIVNTVTGKAVDNSGSKKISTKRTRKRETLQTQDEELNSNSGGNLFHWYLNNANQGEADSQYHAGVMYIKGEQTQRDVDEGVRWIKLSAEQGHEMATTYMKLWSDEFSVNSFDSSISVRWLKEAGRNFDTDAIFNLAFLYETVGGVQKHFTLAMQWYKFAAVEGHAEAKRRLTLLTRNNAMADGASSVQGCCS